MENKCDKCGANPPKNLQKGHGTELSGQGKQYARIVAPRASNKSMRSKKK